MTTLLPKSKLTYSGRNPLDVIPLQEIEEIVVAQGVSIDPKNSTKGFFVKRSPTNYILCPQILFHAEPDNGNAGGVLMNYRLVINNPDGKKMNIAADIPLESLLLLPSENESPSKLEITGGIAEDTPLAAFNSFQDVYHKIVRAYQERFERQ